MQARSFKNIANAYSVIISEKHETHRCIKSCLCLIILPIITYVTPTYLHRVCFVFQYGVLHHYLVALLCSIRNSCFMNISKIADFMPLSYSLSVIYI